MPMASVTLKPGVDVEKTPTLNEAAISSSQLVRFRDGLAEKVGGWVRYYAFTLSGFVRAMHAWQDFNDVKHLAVGGTVALSVISSEENLVEITPQQLQSDFPPNFSTTSGSATVIVNDSNIANVTTFDSVFFATPVSVGGIVLSGVYPVNLVLATTQYNIIASSVATSTETASAITAAAQSNPCEVTSAGHTASDNSLVYIDGVEGMTELNGGLYTAVNTTATTIDLDGIDASGYTAYTSGGTLYPAHVPFFATALDSSLVTVTLQAHGLGVGDTIVFPITTTVGGINILGTYTAVSILDANNFTIQSAEAATSTASAGMNGGDCRLIYDIALGPTAGSTGYGIGTYGSGGYGTGSTSPAQTGTPIVATDYTLDNWGQTILACPRDGGIYVWEPNGGFENAQLISNAPYYNGGIFVSMPAQILVAWGSTQNQTIGIDQDPLTVRWSDQLDYTVWEDTLTNQAGSFRLSNGSRIVAGMQGPQASLLWTDLDLWSMQYVGFPLVYGFNKIGSDCGAASAHSVTQLNSTIFWMGRSNFYALTGSGATHLPCSVWDSVFQDLDTDNLDKCFAWPNSPFNEVWFFFPSASGGTGQCDRYAKLQVLLGTWDYGSLPRTAGIGQSVLGTPIASSVSGRIFQHEQGYNADGGAITASFETGYWMISEGNDISYVDWILPDMKWGTFGGNEDATVTYTFYSVMYPGDDPRVHGPYSVTEATQYINTRIRGRQMKLKVESSDLNSFWRLGRIRFRWAPAGRR